MANLTHDELLELRHAIISAHFTQSRAALLAGIPQSFTASIPDACVPGEQVLIDLDAMNDAGRLANGTLPLETWLSNAVALAGLRQEATVFRRALARCSAPRHVLYVEKLPTHTPQAIEYLKRERRTHLLLSAALTTIVLSFVALIITIALIFVSSVLESTSSPANVRMLLLLAPLTWLAVFLAIMLYSERIYKAMATSGSPVLRRFVHSFDGDKL